MIICKNVVKVYKKKCLHNIFLTKNEQKSIDED